jgi:hypothetical protein
MYTYLLGKKTPPQSYNSIITQHPAPSLPAHVPAACSCWAGRLAD